jgi:hypothetical protein
MQKLFEYFKYEIDEPLLRSNYMPIVVNSWSIYQNISLRAKTARVNFN